MLPDVRADAVRLLLGTLFVRGEADLSSEEDVDEAKSVLAMLGLSESDYSVTENGNLTFIDVGVVKEEVVDEPLIGDESQRVDDENADEEMDVDEDSFHFVEVGQEEVPDENLEDADATGPSLDQAGIRKLRFSQVHTAKCKNDASQLQISADEIKCILCNDSCSTYYNYIVHLSKKHYRQQLLELFKSKNNCPICDKVVVATGNTSLQTMKLLHLGSAHDHVLNVADKAVKDHLDQFRAFGQDYKTDTPAWHKCKAYFTKLKSLIQPCCHDNLNDPQELRYHLAVEHYLSELVSAFGTLGSPCQLCRVGSQVVANSKKDVALHMIISHSKILYDLMPDTGAKMLYCSLKKDMNIKTSSIAKGYKCPLCNLCHDKSCHLRIHMATTHFKHELLREANIQERSTKCTLCEESIGEDDMSIVMWVIDMAKHLGIKHKYLDRVLPADVKQQLEDIENGCTKKIRESKATEVDDNSSKVVMDCPLCPRSFKVSSKSDPLKTHLANTHFQQEVFDFAGVTDILSCPLCEYKHVKNDSKSIGNDKIRMVKHVGLKHRCLDKVMPVKLRMELNEQLAAKMPRTTLFKITEAEKEKFLRSSLPK